ncbi:sigma-70 family RNA polymerase sigma factor [Aurantibacter sp.]|uniref:sigma-70 family RNA polymerase sigma factor n=1 Tax=Aurantibacter sp. TaxID=2807103 RepID=UPI003262D827
METQNIWNKYSNQLYLFILKRVKNTEVSNDIFQNTFFKIHKNLTKLKDEVKVKAWVYQIARNEIANHFNTKSNCVEKFDRDNNVASEEYEQICCFDEFINELPEKYKNVIELIYLEGKKQKDVSRILEISIENVKVRIRRAKDILKERFRACCKYEFDKGGKLVGEANCLVCNHC